VRCLVNDKKCLRLFTAIYFFFLDDDDDDAAPDDEAEEDDDENGWLGWDGRGDDEDGDGVLAGTR